MNEPGSDRSPGASDKALPEETRFNLGCGATIQPGWENLDGSPRAWIVQWLPSVDRLAAWLGRPSGFRRGVRHRDLRRGLPCASGTAACINAGEVWEHLKPKEAAKLTRDCFRALASGGVLRVLVPVGAAFWRAYVELHEAAQKESDPTTAKDVQNYVSRYFKDICVEPSLWMGKYHRWQFDEAQLVQLFLAAGFENVERRAVHDSRIPGIEEIEQKKNTERFLVVEGSKAWA